MSRQTGPSIPKREQPIIEMPKRHFPWVIFRLQGEFFAISCHYVQSMIELPKKVKAVPNTPSHVRGVLDYQGQPVYLIDMRRKIGIQPLDLEINEFIKLMNAREEDHKKWLDALEKCVRENGQFTLATDPTQCRFGRWYREFLPQVKNNNLAFWLKKFDQPHRRIHEIAHHVLDLLAQGHQDRALHVIDQTRDTELSPMIQLFNKLKQVYRAVHSEIIIILDPQQIPQPIGLLVDEIVSVEALPEENWRQIEDYMESGSASVVTGMAEFTNIPSLVTTLDVACLA